jgi:DNA mismatch repair ATPase MutS
MRNGASDRLSREEFIPAEELFDLFEQQISEELESDDKDNFLVESIVDTEIEEMKEAVKLARELWKKYPEPDHFYDEALGIDNEWLLAIAGALQTGDSSDLAI